MPEIPKAQKLEQLPIKNTRAPNGNLITQFQQEAVQSLLNPGKNLASTSGIAGFNQGINETVSLIGTNQQLDQSNNSTLLPGAIVQIPKTPKGETSINQESLAIPTEENITSIAEQNALAEMIKLNQELSSLEPANQIQETKEKGLGILGKMGNWLGENRQIAGISKAANETFKFYKENPEELAKLTIKAIGIGGAAFLLSPVMMVAFLPGGTMAIAGAFAGTYTSIGVAGAGIMAPVLSTLGAIGSLEVSSKVGNMVAGGIKGVTNFLDNQNQQKQPAQNGQQVKISDSNPNLEITPESQNPNQKLLNPAMQTYQEFYPNEDHWQSRPIDTSTMPLNSQIEQNSQIRQNPKLNDQTLEIKSWEEGLEKTKQPEFEQKKLKIGEKIENNQKIINVLGDWQLLPKTSVLFQSKFKNIVRLTVKSEKLDSKFIREVITEIAKMLGQKDKSKILETGKFEKEENKLEFGILTLLQNEMKNLCDNLLEKEKNQVIIDQTAEMTKEKLATSTIRIEGENILPASNSAFEIIDKMKKNGFEAKWINNQTSFIYNPKILSVETPLEIDQKSNLVNLDIYKPEKVENTSNLEANPATENPDLTSQGKKPTQEALLDADV